MVLSSVLLFPNLIGNIGMHLHLEVSLLISMLLTIHYLNILLRLIVFLNYIFLFRGLWGAIDQWTDDFIPDQPRNFLTTACLAVILLIVLGCFNTTSSRGVRNLQVDIKSFYWNI